MSIRILDRVFNLSRSKNGARLVLLALADYANDSGSCYPCRKSIARKANLGGDDEHGGRPLERAIRALVELGELKVEVGRGPKGCNVYTILLPPVNLTPGADLTPPAEMTLPPGVKLTPPPVSKRHPEPSGTVKEPSVNKKNARMTLDECCSFAEQQGLPKSDGESFFYAKEGNGWKNGSNAVKDARATFLNWMRNDWHPSQKAGNGKPGRRSPASDGKPDVWVKPGFDRNAGTLNAGNTSDYSKVGKVSGPSSMPELQ